MFLVYRHRLLTNGKVFYVGITNNVKRPYSKRSRNKYWVNITNKYGFYSEIIYKCDTWEDACELELFLIQEYGRRDLNTGDLVNMTVGGDGVIGQIVTNETRLKLSKSLTEYNRTKEHNLNISKGKIGKSLSKSTIIKRSIKVSKPVVRIEDFREYKSALDASKQTGIDRSSITKVCRNKRKTAGGYTWKYK